MKHSGLRQFLKASAEADSKTGSVVPPFDIFISYSIRKSLFCLFLFEQMLSVTVTLMGSFIHQFKDDKDKVPKKERRKLNKSHFRRRRRRVYF